MYPIFKEYVCIFSKYSLNVEECRKLKRLTMMKSLVDKSKHNRAINANITDILSSDWKDF